MALKETIIFIFIHIILLFLLNKIKLLIMIIFCQCENESELLKSQSSLPPLSPRHSSISSPNSLSPNHTYKNGTTPPSSPSKAWAFKFRKPSFSKTSRQSSCPSPPSPLVKSVPYIQIHLIKIVFTCSLTWRVITKC
jgi:hypothetical protein